MKSFPLTPLNGTLKQIIDSYSTSISREVAVESETHVRPVEIRQFIRDLRQNRQYSYSKNFVY